MKYELSAFMLLITDNANANEAGEKSEKLNFFSYKLFYFLNISLSNIFTYYFRYRIYSIKRKKERKFTNNAI